LTALVLTTKNKETKHYIYPKHTRETKICPS